MNRKTTEIKRRATTEFFIEVEETVAVRMNGKAENGENGSNDLRNERATCPFCGQPNGKIIEIKKGELYK